MTVPPSSDPQAADPIERARQVVRKRAQYAVGHISRPGAHLLADEVVADLSAAGLLISSPAPADDEAAIERMARAMFDRDRAEGCSPFTFDWDEHEQHGKVQMRYEAMAVAALAALREGQKA